MRKENLVRFSAVSVALAMAAGSFMVGCSDDSSGGGKTPAGDSGTPVLDSSAPVADGSTPAADGSTPAADSSTPATDGAAPADAARDGAASDAASDAGPAGPTGILIDVVHASPDTAPVGLCLGGVSGGNVVFPPPFDKVQGPLPRWAGTQISVPSNLVGAIAGLIVRVYLVPGYTPTDAGAPTCASVTGASGPAVLLKEFPAGTFAAGKGYLIAATGCSTPSATAARCGANTADGGSGARPLTPYFAELDRQPVPAANTAAQFVHLAAPLEGIPAFAGGVKIAGGLPTVTDGGTTYNWAAYVTGANPVKFADPPTAKFSAGLPQDPNTLALGVFPSTAPASPANQIPLASIPFGAVALATKGMADPTYFKKGVTYTFIALGDADTTQATDRFRVIALPNNPVN